MIDVYLIHKGRTVEKWITNMVSKSTLEKTYVSADRYIAS